MRNWNFFSKRSFPAQETELRAYLWGIETKDNMIRLGKVVANYCEPTYEELKQTIIKAIKKAKNSLRAYLWGIETFHCGIFFQSGYSDCEPTYEELKHILQSFIDLIHDHCEPTYEELKLKEKIFFQSMWIILRAYLWGIETVMGEIEDSMDGIIASLPMRNWNNTWRSSCHITPVNCEPTYEELKPLKASYSCSISSSYCEPTYEELKLIKPPHEFPYLVVLRAYLWGIETLLSYFVLLLTENIASLPMRNWNTE